MIKHILTILLLFTITPDCKAVPRATGHLGIVIERASGEVMLVETTGRNKLSNFTGLGDLSHASAVFSRDARYAYVFGRDGGLSKLDLLTDTVTNRIIQAGNSIGGAISQDGRLVAVSNYEPGGVKIFDAATLEPVLDIPANYGHQDDLKTSKVIGLVDAPGQKFVFSLYDANEIWIADLHDRSNPEISKFKHIGERPYDALITPDGRYYIAGLFGEDGLALLDLWYPEKGVRRILNGYGRGEKQLPVYKMPHLEGWAKAGDYLFIPAVGHHAILVVDMTTWQETTRITTYGQPVFAIARPDSRHIWVNFAFPNNDVIQVIDVAQKKVIKQLKIGKAVLHMEFTPRGEEVWVSVRDEDRVDIYNTHTFERISHMPASKPSGIFFTNRAHKIGL